MKTTPVKFALCLGIIAFSGIHSAKAANKQWVASPTNANWSTGANWGGTAPVANDSLIFATSSTTTLNNDITAATQFNGITFNSGASAFTLNGNSITLGGNVTNSSTSLQTINLAMAATAVRTFTMTTGGGNITIGGNITGSGGGITTAGAGTLTLSAAGNSYTGATTVANGTTLSLIGSLTGATAITNSGTFTESGAGVIGSAAATFTNSAGTATLSGINTYTGTTTVNGGTLNLDFSGATTPSTATNIIKSGNALTLGGGALVIKGGGSGASNSQTLGTLTINQNTSSTISLTQNSATSLSLVLGGITHNGQSSMDITLPTAGSVTTTLAQAPSNNVLVDSNGAAWATANGGATWLQKATGSSPFALTALSSYATGNGNYTSTNNVDVTNGDSVSGVTVNTLRFNSANSTLTLAGTNTISTGGLLITSSGTGASITGGTLIGAANATAGLYIHDYGTANIGSVIANNAANSNLTIVGTGTTTLSGANTYSGATSINAGTTKLGVSQNGTTSGAFGTGSTALTVAKGATLDLNANSVTVGTLAGDTTTTGGTITSSTSGAASITVGGSTNTTFAGVIQNGSGTVSLTKGGTGNLTLAAANTYSGGTTVSGGTLFLGADGGAANSNSSVVGSGTITLNGGILAAALTNDQNITNNISIGTGSSQIIDSNAKTVTLTGTLSGSGNLTLGNNGTNNTIALQMTNTMTSGTITFASGGGNTSRIRTGNFGNANVNWVLNSANNKTSLEFGNGTISFGSMTGSGDLLQSTAGTTTVSAGALNGANDIFSGTLRQGNGSNIIAFTKVGNGTQTLSGANTFTGGANLNGGLVNLGIVQNGTTSGPLGASGTISFGGGTMQYSSVNQFDYSSRFSTAASQAYSADTNGQSVTWATALTSSGGSLAKSGSGTLTLTGSSTYSGATNITGGTLVLSSTGAINASSGITINGNGAKFVQASSVSGTNGITLTQGTLDGTGTVASGATVTVANLAGNVVQNGNGGTSTLTIGNLTFSGAATVNIADSGTASTPGINVTGTLTTTPASGTITINVTVAGNVWSSGTYDLIQYGSFGGSLSDFTKGTITGITSRQSANLGQSGQFITLIVAGDNPTWAGLDNGNWKVGSTGASSNWKTTSGATDYIEGDTVIFDDSATGTTSVDISAANVSPTSTTFNNSTKSYTISSSGGFGIAGNGSLTKSGTGTVTITTVNSYTGGTNINNGTLALSGSGTLGSSTAVIAMGGGTLDLGATSQTLGAVTITAAATGGNVIQNGTLTASSVTGSNTSGNAIISANLAGTGTVTMSGAGGTLTLSGSNSYTGGTTVGNGTLVLASGGSLSTSNTLTLGSASGNTSGIFQLGDSNGAANTTVASIATAGAGTANAVVGGNASVSALTINNNGAVSYGGLLGGAATNQNNLALVKSGTGALTLSGANTFSGGTTLNAGTIQFSNSAAFGTGTITSTGGTLQLVGAANLTTTNNMVMNSGTTTLDCLNNWTINGNITGSGAISRGQGAGASLFLGGDNSGYTGTFTVLSSPGGSNNAVVRFSSASAGSASASWVFNNTNIGKQTVDFATGTISFGSFTGAGEFRGNNAGTKTLSVGALGLTDTFSGTINDGTGTVALIKTGTGTMTLSGNNSYSGGTTVSAGTLALGNATNTLADTGAVNVNGGTLDIAGNSDTVGVVILTSGSITGTTGTLTGSSYDVRNGTVSAKLGGTGVALTKSTSDTVTLSGNNAYTGATSVTNGTLNLTGALNGSNVSTSSTGVITQSSTGVIAGSGVTFTQGSSGISTLNGANTYTGATTVTSGTLAIGSSGSLASNAVTVNNGATFDVSALSGGYNVASGKALTADGTVTGNIVLSGSLSGASTGSISGTLDATAGSVNASGLAVSGASTFHGAGNTLTGTLNANGGASVEASGDLTLNAGSTLGGSSLAVNGTLLGSGTVGGATTVANGGFMKPGSDTTTATIALNNNVTFNDGSYYIVAIDDANNTSSKLTINGNLSLNGTDTLVLNLLNSTPTTNSFVIATYSGTLTGTFSADLSGVPGYTIDYGTGTNSAITLMPVPEPGTWAMVLGGFGMLGFYQKLRRKRSA